MRYTASIATAAALSLSIASHVVATPDGEKPWKAPLRRWADEIRKRQTCGEGVGNCPDGQCCSEGGFCGTSEDYCKSPACQVDYSNGSCDADQKPCGSSTEDVPRNTDGDAPYDKYITSCTEDNTIALTFDDGPYLYTTAILDLLKQYDAKATFFITGNNLGKGQIDNASTPWPAVIRRAHAEGHQIASHTWSHPDLSAATAERRKTEFIYNEMALRNILGFFPTYMRPPMGTCSRDSGCLDYATGLGYHVVTWDVDTKDYLNNTPDTIQASKDLFDQGLEQDGSHIVLSHDIQQETAQEFAEYMLKQVKAKGLKTATVGECLGDAEENWYTQDAADSDCQIPDTCDTNAKKREAVTVVSRDVELTVSTDGTCGERSGDKFTCKGSKYGDCCSYNGWCGKTSGYCDGGCQDDFGSCNSWKCGDELIISENGLCGGDTHQTCLFSSFGNCCSVWGNCGKSDDYCTKDKGCQADFGKCE